MPYKADGSLRSFTPTEITAMQLETTNVRGGEHPAETREVGQSTMRRSYFCKWEERYNAVELICGNQTHYFDEVQIRYRISRLDPDSKFGRHPKAPNFYATKVEHIRGQGRCLGEDADGMPMYPRARLDVLFETVPYSLESDTDVLLADFNEIGRYVWTTGSEVSGSSITGKGGMMRFRRAGGLVPDGVPIPYSYNVIRPESEWSLFWTRVPYGAITGGSKLDLAVHRGGTAVGMVNSLPFYGQAAGTVLFLGTSLKLKRPQVAIINPNNDIWTWDVEYKFVSAPDGWLNLRYFDLAGAGANSGFFYAGSGALKTPATVNDYESIVRGARDLNDALFVAG